MNSELVFGGGEKIEKLIYEIRGKQVMLDSDLARLYKCVNGTKTINLAVKRHKDRFPKDFCFRLNEEEAVALRSQIVTSNDDNFRFQVGTKDKERDLRFQFETSKMRGGRRYKTYVFTEQGVAMLATILRTEVASQVSVAIMRAFVAMRHYFDDSSYRLSNVESKIIEHDKNIKLLQESFQRFDEKRKLNEIYFNGQIYDAYFKILEIFKEAENELTIIDTYVDNTILNMIKNLNVRVMIITKKNGPLNKQDIEKYNEQYENLRIVYDNTFHDRYFILDKKTVYHCGASINRIGYKTFSINRISDEKICDLLVKRIEQIAT